MDREIKPSSAVEVRVQGMYINVPADVIIPDSDRPQSDRALTAMLPLVFKLLYTVALWPVFFPGNTPYLLLKY